MTAQLARAPAELRILAIDPGPESSGYVVFDGEKVKESGVVSNADMRLVIFGVGRDAVAIEMIASYGMAVGKEVFETCVWIGRFMECCNKEERVELVYRRDIKLHLCGSPRAKDANIRQALIDKLGAPGTKKNPGATYGVKSHAWAALAVAVTAYETRRAA